MDQLPGGNDVVGVVSHGNVNHVYSAIWLQRGIRHALLIAGKFGLSRLLQPVFLENIPDGLHWEIFLVGVGLFSHDGYDARQGWVLFMLGLFGFLARLLLFSCILRNHTST